MRLPKEALVGLDGLEREEAPPAKAPSKTPPTPLTLAAESSARLKAEIERAGGREVCFLARVDEGRPLADPPVASQGRQKAQRQYERRSDEESPTDPANRHPGSVPVEARAS